MEVNKLQKEHTRKNKAYGLWKSQHCRETHYLFQVRKCNDEKCCPVPSRPFEELKWVPSPLLEDDKLHYKAYETLKEGQMTTDRDRPSLLIPKAKPGANKSTNSSKKNDEEASTAEPLTKQAKIDSCSMSGQTARAIITCVESRKPRVVYCSTKLDYRHKVMLARNMSSFEYTCGSFLFPPSEQRKLAKAMIVRQNLTCGMQVEVSYYTNGDLGRRVAPTVGATKPKSMWS